MKLPRSWPLSPQRFQANTPAGLLNVAAVLMEAEARKRRGREDIKILSQTWR